MPHQDKSFSPFSRAVVLLASAVMAAGTGGCGSGILQAAPASIASTTASNISAPAGSVRVGQTLQLVTQAKATGSPMTFWIDGVQGGNAQLGTIDANGLYTAPAAPPSPDNSVTITAEATNFPQAPKGSAMVSVLNPIPVIAQVAPAVLSEGTTTITISGSQFVYGAQILWNGTPVSTTYISSTALAASITAATPGNYSLAVDNPDPGPANSAVLSQLVSTGQVTVALNTGSITDVRVGNPIHVGLTVGGTNNTAVTWAINGVAGGSAQLGTIASNPDGSGTYTAPAVVPTPVNTVQLSATSVDDPTVSAIQNISVLNPIPVLAAATPTSFDAGPATVVLTGSQFIKGAQVLVNGAAVPTVFNSPGELTGTFTPAQPGTLDLQVANPAPGPATSTDLIAQINGTPTTPLVSPEDASRFLAEATFGPTDSDIHHVSQVGYQAWLAEQFSTPATLHEPFVEQSLLLNSPPCATGDTKCYNVALKSAFYTHLFLPQTFWQQAIAGNDQLRQRVEYALTELMVVSSLNSDVEYMPRGQASYLDVLGADSFGNFRQLLEDVTLHPVMGEYLSMLGNDKGDANRDPDENYAREVMQLLTIGLYQLNPDGTQKLDATGQPIPTYSNLDVMGIAKVFTGFSWNIPGDQSETAWSNGSAYLGPGFGEDMSPMQPFPNHHSTSEKDFLGVTVPASVNPDPVGDLKIALDTLFNHPNLPPFFAKQMIQHLVTSNPSPAYVGRVAAAFQDNGQGVRGDMKAVIAAILLDDEARNSAAAANNPEFGKLREPLIRYTQWARAFTAQSRNGVFNLGSTEDPVSGLGEMSLRSPSVFNWFAPGYVPPGTSIEKAGLLAPEMGMTDVSTVVGYLNYMQNAITSTATSGSDVFSSYSTEIALAANPDQLLDRINLLLMAGQMDSTLRSQVLAAVNSVTIPTGNSAAVQTALADRVEAAIYLTMASPAFAAQY